MNITIDASAITAMAEAWKRAPQIVIEELTAATLRAENALLEKVVELTPVGAHGFLRASMETQTPEVLGNTVLGMVGTPMSYAEPVELGTKPHPVSAAGVMSIEDWVRHKLGVPEEDVKRVTSNVVWKIRMRGTPAVGMFHRGLAHKRTELAGIFEDAAGWIVQRLAGTV